MVKTQPVSDDLTDPTETLITEFIEFWENHWVEADRYGQSERAMIRAHLYYAVARRFLATGGGELHFTKKELKQAIQSAVEEVKSTRKGDRDEVRSGRICNDYLVRRLVRWDRQEEFTNQELVVIRTRLYGNVMDRYRRSGFVDLHFTKKELRGAVETVEAIRERNRRQAQADDRDRRIRRVRQGEQRRIVRELNRV